jgi:hypothetical protein
MINVVLSILLFVALKVAVLGVFAHGWSRRRLLLSAAMRLGSSTDSGPHRVIVINPPLMESHDGHATLSPLTSGLIKTHTRFSESGRIAART